MTTKTKARERHALSIMGPEGHAEIVWDVHDYDSITNAKKMFEKLVGSGFQAFSVEREEAKVSKGTRVRKFDPSLEEIIMVPKVAGG